MSAKRAALYLRTSTDEQTTENQRRELEAVAKRHGWVLAEVFQDNGVSGRLGREKRPGRSRQVVTVCGPATLVAPVGALPDLPPRLEPDRPARGPRARHQRLARCAPGWSGGRHGVCRGRRPALEDPIFLAVSPETVRPLRPRSCPGRALDQAQQADRATVERTRAPAGGRRPAPAGSLKPMACWCASTMGWHEVKLGVVGGWDPAAPPGTASALWMPRVTWRPASRWGCFCWFAGGRRSGAAGRPGHPRRRWPGHRVLGCARPRAVVVLGDLGARWIWTAAAEQFGERLEIVDWYHASEHVPWTVARAWSSVLGTAAACGTGSR